MWFHDFLQIDFSRFASFPFPVIPSCIFKICQIVTSISMTSHFHKFLYVIFGGFLLFETFARRCRSCWWRLWCGWRSPAPWGSWSRRSPSPGVYLNFAHRARLWDVHVPTIKKRLTFNFYFLNSCTNRVFTIMICTR